MWIHVYTHIQRTMYVHARTHTHAHTRTHTHTHAETSETHAQGTIQHTNTRKHKSTSVVASFTQPRPMPSKPPQAPDLCGPGQSHPSRRDTTVFLSPSSLALARFCFGTSSSVPLPRSLFLGCSLQAVGQILFRPKKKELQGLDNNTNTLFIKTPHDLKFRERRAHRQRRRRNYRRLWLNTEVSMLTGICCEPRDGTIHPVASTGGLLRRGGPLHSWRSVISGDPRCKRHESGPHIYGPL
jgi:hypothetical protein